jgi:rubredoxin
MTIKNSYYSIATEQHEEIPMEATCPMCGCMNYPIAMMGWLIHYHCRDCGMWYSAEVQEVDTNTEEE